MFLLRASVVHATKKALEQKLRKRLKMRAEKKIEFSSCNVLIDWYTIRQVSKRQNNFREEGIYFEESSCKIEKVRYDSVSK